MVRMFTPFKHAEVFDDELSAGDVGFQTSFSGRAEPVLPPLTSLQLRSLLLYVKETGTAMAAGSASVCI
jgi:hypothetical protein